MYNSTSTESALVVLSLPFQIVIFEELDEAIQAVEAWRYANAVILEG